MALRKRRGPIALLLAAILAVSMTFLSERASASPAGGWMKIFAFWQAIVHEPVNRPAEEPTPSRPVSISTKQADPIAVDRSGEEPTPPRLVSFSGQLAHVAGKGIVGVTFAIYKEAEAGTPLWIETQNVDVDENGRFTVNLGAATEGGIPIDLFTSGTGRWLSIQRIPEVEQPRILLASVAYALKASDAETLGGKPLSAFILADDTNSIQQKDGTRTLKPKTNTFGTTNYIGKFTDPNNLGNSVLYDNGSAIGLLTTSPAAALHINSVSPYRNLGVGVLVTGAYPGVLLENSTTSTSAAMSESNGLAFFTRGAGGFTGADQRMIITSAGRVGIGTGAPQGPLHIGTIAAYRNLNLGSIQTGSYPGILLENTSTGSSAAITEANGLAVYVRPSPGGVFTGSDLRMTVNTNGGVTITGPYPSINFGNSRFIHNFGSQNTFIGENAGSFSGFGNTGSGYYALSSNTSGNYNTANGWGAMNFNTGGYENAALGDSALYFNTTGSYNIAVGAFAGYNLTTGSYNIDIGNQGLAAEGNTIRIGDSNQTRAFIAGIRGVTTGVANGLTVLVDSNGQLGTISSSARVKRDIADIGEATSALLKLRPVSFFYRNDTVGIRQYGLIAEEVAEVMPELVQFSEAGQPETVRYHFLTPLLLHELQKQQETIEKLRQTIDEMRLARAPNEALEARIDALQRKVEQLTRMIDGKKAQQ